MTNVNSGAADPTAAADAVASRGQNQLHIIPEDWDAAADVLLPLLDRLDPAKGATQLLVITGDAESAAALSGRLVRAADERTLRALAATESRRAARVLKSLPAHVVVTHPLALIELTKGAAVKLDGVTVVALAWVESLSAAATRALESIMGELPKDSARVVIAAHPTPEVDQLVERYARRARRVLASGTQPHAPMSLSYVTTSESGKLGTLRRVLDALDPEKALVVARPESSRVEARRLLRSMGYAEDGAVRVVDVPASAPLVVLLDFPTDEADLRRSDKSRVVALVAPRQLATLRRLAGGSVTPLALPEAAVRAQTREEALRAEVKGVLETGQYARELLALEPLLEQYDGSEIAAAALRLLEAERAKPAGAAGVSGGAPAMTRLYVNVGEMDQVRPTDIVGAITNEAGIARAEVGRVDVREKHSTVEVATVVAHTVVEKMTGVAIRGRRALVKIDEDRPPRPARSTGSGRDGPRRDRGDRPQRPTRPTRPRPPR